MTSGGSLHPPRTESEFRAERLGTALRSLAAELIDERRKVAQLRRELAKVRSQPGAIPPSPLALIRDADSEAMTLTLPLSRAMIPVVRLRPVVPDERRPETRLSPPSGVEADEGWPRRMASRPPGDAERKRIQQDIHDGVQQHLTALRIRLRLAAETFHARGDTDASGAMEAFGDDVEGVIDELRDVTQGIYPALLTSSGLSAALASAGRRAGQPVRVRARNLRRCRPEIEIAVYFTCLAAIDNAAKHAGPAQVTVRLSDTGPALHFTVSDSGTGFDPDQTPAGAGIANMRDRITAVGGVLSIDSIPGRGTSVDGCVPDPWQDAALGPREQAQSPG